MKKSLLTVATVATIGLGAAVPAATTIAAHAETGSTSTSTSLVDKIASKFNLNKADVQKVFDEDRATHEAERTQAVKDKLATAVKEGKITQAQSDKITAKLAEIRADMEKNRDAMKDKTDAERKAAMDAKKAELDAWAKDNGIDTSYLMLGHGHGMHGGPRSN